MNDDSMTAKLAYKLACRHCRKYKNRLMTADDFRMIRDAFIRQGYKRAFSAAFWTYLQID